VRPSQSLSVEIGTWLLALTGWDLVLMLNSVAYSLLYIWEDVSYQMFESASHQKKRKRLEARCQERKEKTEKEKNKKMASPGFEPETFSVLD
jgi:hypothetical protein